MGSMTMAAQDKKWQKECDARTLADAEAIKADSVRFKGATSQAKVMAKEKEKEVQAMNKVAGAGKRTPSRNTAKGGATVKSNTNLPFRKSKNK